MKKGDIVLLKNGNVFQIVDTPLVKGDLTIVQFLGGDGGSFIDIHKKDVQEVFATPQDKLNFAMHQLLHERLNRLGTV